MTILDASTETIKTITGNVSLDQIRLLIAADLGIDPNCVDVTPDFDYNYENYGHRSEQITSARLRSIKFVAKSRI